jgi:hypothetical protein
VFFNANRNETMSLRAQHPEALPWGGRKVALSYRLVRPLQTKRLTNSHAIATIKLHKSRDFAGKMVNFVAFMSQETVGKRTADFNDWFIDDGTRSCAPKPRVARGGAP